MLNTQARPGKREEPLRERLFGRGLRGNATFAVALVALLSGMVYIERALMTIGLYGETWTQAMFDSSTNPWGFMLIIVALGGMLILGLLMAFGHVHIEARALIGILVVLSVFGLIGAALAGNVASTSSNNIAGAPPQAQISGHLDPLFETGCQVSAVPSGSLAGQITCTGVYNYTSSKWAVSATNQSTFKLPNVIYLPMHIARVDNGQGQLNQTYGFTWTWSLGTGGTVVTTGNNPTTYSPIVGYKPATSVANGIWLTNWTTGSSGTANPSEAAPSVTSSVGSTITPLAPFKSVDQTLSIDLPGTGGSSAPSGLYSVFSPYASSELTVSVFGLEFNVYFQAIGEHA